MVGCWDKEPAQRAGDFHLAAHAPGEQAAHASVRNLLLVGDLLNCAARQLTQQ